MSIVACGLLSIIHIKLKVIYSLEIPTLEVSINADYRYRNVKIDT